MYSQRRMVPSRIALGVFVPCSNFVFFSNRCSKLQKDERATRSCQRKPNQKEKRGVISECGGDQGRLERPAVPLERLLGLGIEVKKRG